MTTVQINTSMGARETSLKTAHLSKRRVFITGPITEEMASDVIMQLIWLQEESEDPITIYINSPGGEITAGLAIYDVITGMPVPVTIICCGMAASMAALLLAAGPKGSRYILPHSGVMIHEPYLAGGVGGSAGALQNTAQELMRMQDTFNNLLATCTGHSKVEIEIMTNHDNFLSAEEAVKFGICDEVISRSYDNPGCIAPYNNELDIPDDWDGE